MQKKLIKKTKKISKNRNNTKKYKTQRGGNNGPPLSKKAKIEGSKSSFVFKPIVFKPPPPYISVNEVAIAKQMKEYEDFKINYLDNSVHGAIKIVTDLQSKGYIETNPDDIEIIIEALACIQRGIVLFNEILNKLSNADNMYYNAEIKAGRRFKPIIDSISQLEILLNDVEDNFPVNSEDTLNKYASKLNIDLPLAYQNKQSSKKIPNTYYNFVIAAKIYSALNLYYKYSNIIMDSKIKTVNFIDCENMIMRNFQSKKSISRAESYENLVQNIGKTHINPDEIIILVNRTDISSENDLFGKLDNNFYYVNAKCMGHDNCEADDFLMMIMLHDIIEFGHKDCKIMSHDKYDWLGVPTTRFTINTSNPSKYKTRNSSTTSTNTIRESAKKFAESYN